MDVRQINYTGLFVINYSMIFVCFCINLKVCFYQACPRQIKITKRINQIKQRIKVHRELTGDPANDGTNHP